MSISSSRPKVSVVDPANPAHALVPDASGAIAINNFPATQPISGTVTVNALPVGSNNIGGVELIDSAGTNKASISSGGALKIDGSGVTQPVSIAAAVSVNATAETSQISNAGTQLTPKFAPIVASASGATTIVSAVTSKKIRVLSMNLTVNAAVNVKWQSHVTPTDKTGLAYLAANGGYILPYHPLGWFETIAGEALDINLSAAVAVGGHLTYVEV